MNMRLLYSIYFALLSLRYDVTFVGLENLKKDKHMLILPNHPGIIDPQIVISGIGRYIDISPLVTEGYFNIPILKNLFNAMGALPMPDLTDGDKDIDRVKKVFKDLSTSLGSGKNIVVYPAGQIYSQGFEMIIGKKTAYNLVSQLPKGTQIIGVRTTGIWGSMWSKAWTGTNVNFFKIMIYSIFLVFANLIFFLPKRKVTINIEPLTDIFMDEDNSLKINDLNEFNARLEKYYNQGGVEEMNYVKHFFYHDDVKFRSRPTHISGSKQDLESKNDVDISKISHDIKDKIITKIHDMKQIDKNKILPESNLVLDLYLDSLDVAEIKSFVQDSWKMSSNPPILDLKTVGDLMVMAIGKSSTQQELKDCKFIKKTVGTNLFQKLNKNVEIVGGNKNILSLLKLNFIEDRSENIIYDNLFGTQSVSDYLIKAYLISIYIKKYPGKYVGIMLPSVSSVSVLIIATYLAGKVPVMLNWTLGSAAFDHCNSFVDSLDANGMKIFSSKTFYDKVVNDSIEKHKDKFIFLDVMLSNIPLFTKIKALIFSKLFIIPRNLSNQAVILFTSGSEALPKAVSLTHDNIISDILGALSIIDIDDNDVLLGFLPPFHSFGFSINTILPLITGLKVAYSPDPNDGQVLAKLSGHVGASFVTSTPTFFRMILNQSKPHDLNDIKYVVLGAEKCPEDLLKNVSQYCPRGKILEGYGITECSPVISVNPTSLQKTGSVGKPIFGLDVKICGIDDDIEVGIGEQGMIYVAGPSVFDGYDKSENKDPFRYIGGVKYYQTGDLGYLDEDGYLFITGRLKRFVKIAGEMVSLPFVEGVLNKRYGTDIAIEALEKDGKVKIVLFGLEEISVDEANDHLRTSGVSNLVKISEFMKVSEIPVLGTGKFDYKELKKLITF